MHTDPHIQRQGHVTAVDLLSALCFLLYSRCTGLLPRPHVRNSVEYGDAHVHYVQGLS